MAAKSSYDPKKSLINVQGNKKYLPAADRLIMANTEAEAAGVEMTISSEILHLDPDIEFVVVRSTVHFPGHGTGCGIKSQWGTKSKAGREGFGAYIEKAQTGSIGRALAQIGFGTEDAYEFRMEDYQEGDDLSGAINAPRSAPQQEQPVRQPAPPARTASTPAGGATTPATQAPSFAAQAAGDIAAAHEESVAALKEKVRAAAREDGYTLEKWSDWRQLGARLDVGDPGADPATLTTGWCGLVLNRLKTSAVH